MTIASQTSRISYVGDGSTTAFAVPFFFAANSDIVVYLQNSSGVQTLQVLGTNYTLTGAGVSGGGTCTFTAAPTSTTGAVITIYRDPPLTQTTSYNNNDPFPAKSHEAALDKLTMLEQRTRDMISRSLRLPDSDPTLSTQLPTLASRANKLLGFDTNGLPTAVLGPSFVGGTDVGAAVVSTKAVAQITTFAASVLYLIIGGTSAAGDTPQQTFIRGSGSGGFTDGGGVAWKPVPLNFGTSIGSVAVGDGATDDRAAFQAAIDAVLAAGAGALYLTPGKTYRIVINGGVTDFGLILKAGITLYLNGATINLECDGQVYGVRPLSGTRIIGPGTIRTSVSTGLSATLGAEQSIWHAPVSLGTAGGGGGTVGSVSPYLSPTDIVIDGVTFDSVRNNGQGGLIAGVGGFSNITIRNNIFPDNSKIAMAIAIDWNWVGTISSGDLAGNATRYNAGTAYTVHPHGLRIENNRIGKMTMAAYAGPFGSHGIRLSGVYDARVVGNEIDETTFAGIFITGGDLSFEYALAHERYHAMKGITVENNVLRECNTWYGIYSEAYPDNVYSAATDSGNPQYPYTPFFYYDGYQANTRIVGNTLIAGTSLGVSNAEGIFVQFTKGCLVADNIVQGFKTGIRAGKGSVDVEIDRNSVTIAAQAGILVSDGSSLPPIGTTVRKNRAFRNCSDGGTQGNICVDYATRTIIFDNHIGSSDEDHSSVGINVTSNAAATSVKSNRVQQVKAGGTAYVLSNATAIDAIWEFSGNIYDGLDTFMSGLPILPVERTRRPSGGGYHTRAIAKAAAMTGGVTPTIGTWFEGDLIEIEDAGAGAAAIARKRVVWASLVNAP